MLIKYVAINAKFDDGVNHYIFAKLQSFNFELTDKVYYCLQLLMNSSHITQISKKREWKAQNNKTGNNNRKLTK